MPRKHYNHKEPETQMEALSMVGKSWYWLVTKNPVVFIPLTFWMLFGGGIFFYNYVSADKVTIKEAKPISENTDIKFSIVPQAYATGDQGVPIRYNGQLWGYEDTNFVAKVDKNRPIILVYDKRTKEVKEVSFDLDLKYRLQKKY